MAADSQHGWTYSPAQNLYGIASDCGFGAVPSPVKLEVRSDGTTHSYSFGVYCGRDDDEFLARISVTYNTQTNVATENDVQVTESNRRVSTTYTCDSDPWIVTGAPVPACTRTSESLSFGSACNAAVIGASGFVCDDPPDLPYSVAVLGDQPRMMLSAAVAAATQQVNAPAQGSSTVVATPTPNPLIVLGGHLPGSPSGSFQGGATPANFACLVQVTCSQTLAVVTSPSPNQAVHGDVALNVVRASQNADDGVFQIEWDYQTSGGNWAIADSGQLPSTLDKTQNPSGLTAPGFLFTAQCSASNMTTCQWRVRAQLSNPSGTPWSDYVRFTVQ